MQTKGLVDGLKEKNLQEKRSKELLKLELNVCSFPLCLIHSVYVHVVHMWTHNNDMTPSAVLVFSAVPAHFHGMPIADEG